MADYIFNTETPTGQDFDGGWHTVGVKAAVSVAAVAIGGRAYYPSSLPANFLWLLYRVSDMAVVAQVNLNALGGTNNAWNTFTSAQFQTPGNVALDPGTFGPDTGEHYIPAIATNGDYKFANPFTYPIAHAGRIISASEGRFFTGGAGATFPSSSSSTFAFFADVLVQPASTAVAVTGRAVGFAGSTSASAKKAVTTSRLFAVGSLTVVAKKLAVVTSAGVAVAGSSATAAKRVPVAGQALGLALPTISNLNVRAVTGSCVGIAIARNRPSTAQPGGGTVARPNTGLVVRPYTGVVPH